MCSEVCGLRPRPTPAVASKFFMVRGATCPWARQWDLEAVSDSRKSLLPWRYGPWSQWRRPWPSSSMWVVPTGLPLGQRPGKELRSTDTLSRHQSSSGSIAPWQVPLTVSGHSPCPLGDTSQLPREATVCKR